MALDTTVGSATADSMISLAEANSYLETFFSSDAGLVKWQDLDISMQEEMLRMAASFFSFLPLRGTKAYLATDTTQEQSMPFPRTTQTDITLVPTEIRYCQAEIAFCIIFRTYISRTSITDGAATSAQVKKLGLGGLLSIEFSATGETSGSIMEQFTRGITSLTWMRINKYITQIRGDLV